MNNKLYDKVKLFFKENLRFIIFLAFIVFILTYDTGYVVETPGGFISLDTRVKVEDGYSSQGNFGMAYVSMIQGKIPFVLLSYIFNDWDLVPVEDITLPDEDLETENERDKYYMKEAVNNAIVNAYTNANKYFKVENNNLYVLYIMNDNSNISLFDQIKKIDGKEINSMQDIKNIIDNKDISDIATVEVLRDGKLANVTSSIIEVDGEKKLGVSLCNITDLITSPNVNVDVKKNESGPSGGLMMSLEIYNQLTEEDITKGMKIIGTGTIDEDGTVGEIGGVKHKLIGAVKKGAQVFICPKENYEEAIKVKNDRNYDIMIIGVSNFSNALEELKLL